jgi:hypothetical protein
MTKYYVDTTTYNDFDTVIRYLHAKKIPIIDRNKVKMMVSAELTLQQIEEIQALPLEETVSIGEKPLL